MDLPIIKGWEFKDKKFKDIEYSKKNESYDEFVKNLKKEKNMNGNEIRDKLIKVLEKDFVINK